ncbi:Transcriptional regulator, LysR family [Labilithrix luteola]|uniref:Transcriptional regulator, LysR family n=1 Tax=Labilithrix luteola TaxID=1391654 RepID=A0A0K1PVE8_9BACT|nr:LysR family transcriptional regulator [Labilithrix luteola]AKU97505.1 Transcriptional regulator, LysR family [Labilithrix luteola]
MQDVVWRDLEVFLALHRTGSHARAAKALGIDPTTVGRRLGTLEEGLGTRLFVRTPKGLSLTAMGTTLLPRALRVEEEMVSLGRELQGADANVEGTVRLTAGDGFVRYVLVPALAKLREGRPRLTIELRAETQLLDLSRREADVAVRLVAPKEPALVSRNVGSMAFGIFASRPYLDRRGSIKSTRDLASHDWIGFESELDRLPQNRWLRELVPAIRYVVRATATTIQTAACVEGVGLALLPEVVALHERSLVRVLPKVSPPPRAAFAVYHSDLKKNARVALVVRWVSGLMDEVSARQTP